MMNRSTTTAENAIIGKTYYRIEFGETCEVVRQTKLVKILPESEVKIFIDFKDDKWRQDCIVEIGGNQMVSSLDSLYETAQVP